MVVVGMGRGNGGQIRGKDGNSPRRLGGSGLGYTAHGSGRLLGCRFPGLFGWSFIYATGSELGAGRSGTGVFPQSGAA